MPADIFFNDLICVHPIDVNLDSLKLRDSKDNNNQRSPSNKSFTSNLNWSFCKRCLWCFLTSDHHSPGSWNPGKLFHEKSKTSFVASSSSCQSPPKTLYHLFSQQADRRSQAWQAAVRGSPEKFALVGWLTVLPFPTSLICRGLPVILQGLQMGQVWCKQARQLSWMADSNGSMEPRNRSVVMKPTDD